MSSVEPPSDDAPNFTLRCSFCGEAPSAADDWRCWRCGSPDGAQRRRAAAELAEPLSAAECLACIAALIAVETRHPDEQDAKKELIKKLARMAGLRR